MAGPWDAFSRSEAASASSRGGGGAVLRAALQGGLARCLSPGGGLSSRVSEAL